MSAKTLNIALSPELDRFVRERVESGLYASASEVVREALRLLARHESSQTPIVSGTALANAGDLQEQRIDRASTRDAIDELRRLRKGTILGPGLTVRQLIDEGRR
jgi:antitoxin ParD1/3/4